MNALGETIGEPEVITDEEEGQVIVGELSPEPPPEDGGEQPRRKNYVNGGQVEVAAHIVHELDADGKELRVVTLTDHTAEKVRSMYRSAAELRSKWSNAQERATIITSLEQHGISLEELMEASKQPDADPFDVVCNVAFSAPLRTRRERAECMRWEKKDFLEDMANRHGRFSTIFSRSTSSTARRSLRFLISGSCHRSRSAEPYSRLPVSSTARGICAVQWVKCRLCFMGSLRHLRKEEGMTDNQSRIEPTDQSSQPEMANLPEVPSGPPVYTNWVALNGGMPWLVTEEYPLFTDAWITGEVSQGPYHFLNTVPRQEPGLVQPAIALRCERHAQFPQPDMTKTDVVRYHGGSFPEEIAALSSVAMGIRLRAGGVTRRFEPNGDPKGRPSEWGARPFTGLIPRKDTRGWVLANASEGAHPLTGLEILAYLPRLSAPDAVALVRAARLYQEALWLVESEPALSWLMLVSAVETAANQWRRAQEAPVDRLKVSKPKLYQYLAGLGPEVPAVVAEHIADALGATSKFVGFVLRFLPPPPSARPAEGFQHPWSKTAIRETMGLIYHHRSRALHDGTPYPVPMCEIPFRSPEWPAPAERPMGGATAAQGGVWLSEDAPMLLHMFEYIVRAVLLEWWRQGAPVEEPVAGES